MREHLVKAVGVIYIQKVLIHDPGRRRVCERQQLTVPSTVVAPSIRGCWSIQVLAQLLLVQRLFQSNVDAPSRLT